MIQGNYIVADKCNFIIFQKTNNLSSSSLTFLIHMPRFSWLCHAFSVELPSKTASWHAHAHVIIKNLHVDCGFIPQS